MRYSLAAELLLASTASALLEVPVVKRDKHDHRTANVARGLVRRASTLETTLFSGIGFVSGGAYYANITVGTPPQAQTVLLDTGSSDLYLDASTAAECQTTGAHKCEGGTFDLSKSSTLHTLTGDTFNATYGDGSTAVGTYRTDVVCINDICLEDAQFALATTVRSTVGDSVGVMGIGDIDIEGVTSRQDLYDNIPAALKAAGVINSRLYSLYLNDYDAITGSILFGGIDTDKYTGTLQTTNTLPDEVTGFVDQFITTITACKTSVGGKTTSIWTGGASGAAAYKSGTPSLPVLLDSGSSAWSVPSSYYKKIVKEFTYVDASTGVAPCSHAYSGDSVTLTINDQIDITVDISEFLLPLYNPNTNEPEMYSNGDQACGFEIIPSPGTGEGFETMGDAMLRSMYVVYDLDLGQLSIAQAKQNSTSSNVVEVQAGAGGVAKAAGSSGKTTGPQSYSVFPSLSASTSIGVSTAKSAVGTATGLAAVPTAARVVGEKGGSGTSSGSGSGSSSSSGSGSSGSGSKSGAAGVVAPTVAWSGIFAMMSAALLAVFGAAFMM